MSSFNSEVEWCQTRKQNLQKSWSLAVEEAAQVAALTEVDVPPDILAAMVGKDRNVDSRPHFYDPKLKQCLLVDSGSAVTAWPPDPGDKIDPSMKLRAVNGSKLNCYGYKKITIQLNRKKLHFQAIKADVATPIIGWDFIKHHRLNFYWKNLETLSCVIDSPELNLS